MTKARKIDFSKLKTFSEQDRKIFLAVERQMRLLERALIAGLKTKSKKVEKQKLKEAQMYTRGAISLSKLIEDKKVRESVQDMIDKRINYLFGIKEMRYK